MLDVNNILQKKYKSIFTKILKLITKGELLIAIIECRKLPNNSKTELQEEKVPKK